MKTKKEITDGKKQIIAQRLRALRTLAGYSQEGLCDVAKMPFGTYAGWETIGRKPREGGREFQSLAKVLRIGINNIIAEVPVTGHRIWVFFSGGVPSDVEKSLEAIDAQLLSLLPRKYELRKAMCDDGALFMLAVPAVEKEKKPQIIIAVETEFVSRFEELLKINASGGQYIIVDDDSTKAIQIRALSSRDLALADLPQDALVLFRHDLSLLRCTQYKMQFAPFILGVALKNVNLPRAIAENIAYEYSHLLFSGEDVDDTPQKSTLADIAEAIMYRYDYPLAGF